MQKVINSGLYDGRLFFMDEQRNSMYLSLILYKETLEECNKREYKELEEEKRKVLPISWFTGEETRIRSAALLELQGWLVKTKKAKIMDYTYASDAARLPDLDMVEWWVRKRKEEGLPVSVGVPEVEKQVFDNLDLNKLTDEEWDNVLIFKAGSDEAKRYRESVYANAPKIKRGEHDFGETIWMPRNPEEE